MVAMLGSSMNDSQKTELFRAQLERQREQVLAEMANHRPSVDRLADDEEKADRAASNYVEIGISANDGNLLQKIEFALERLDAGTYQQCEHCGGEIPFARLEAKPSVSLCLQCQEQKDAGQIPAR